MSDWKQFPLGVVKAPLSDSRTVPDPVVNEGHFLSGNFEELLMSPWAPEFHGLCFVVGLFSLIEPEACVPFNEEGSILLVQEFSCIFFSPLVISFVSSSLVFILRAPVIWLLVPLDSL